MQVPSKSDALDHADPTAPARQHELWAMAKATVGGGGC